MVRGLPPTTRVTWPWPVRSSASRTSPGPKRLVEPSPTSISPSPSSVTTYCRPGAQCQSRHVVGGLAGEEGLPGVGRRRCLGLALPSWVEVQVNLFEVGLSVVACVDAGDVHGVPPGCLVWAECPCFAQYSGFAFTHHGAAHHWRDSPTSYDKRGRAPAKP